MAEISIRTIQGLGGEYEIALWTNEVELLPKTETWCEDQGIKMKSLLSLTNYPDHQELLKRIISENVVMASDLARFMIL